MKNKIDLSWHRSPEANRKDLLKVNKTVIVKSYVELWADRNRLEGELEKAQEKNTSLRSNEAKGVVLQKGLNNLVGTVKDIQSEILYRSEDRTETRMNEGLTVEIKAQDIDYKSLYHRLVGEITMFDNLTSEEGKRRPDRHYPFV